MKPLSMRSVSPAIDRSDVAGLRLDGPSEGQRLAIGVARDFNLSPGEKWGQWCLAHDLGVMDVFMALTQRGTLVPLSEAERLTPARVIRDRRISVWQSVPSALNFMLRGNQPTGEYLASLRVMSFCGEPLRRKQLQSLFNACPDLTVFNTYGATETIGFNTLNRLTAKNFMDSCELESAAIGEDVPGWSTHLRGDHDDEEGEIVVASDFLSTGYWHDEEQTRAAFRQV